MAAAALIAGCTGSIGDPSSESAGAGGGGAIAPSNLGGRTGTSGSSATGSGGTTAGRGPTSAGGSVAGGTNCTPSVPPTSQIPRLTNDEYDRTVRDLLGVTGLTAQNGAAPSSLLATDQAGGLTNVGWSAYKTVAEDIAAQVIADPSLKGKFISCDPGVGTCLHDTVVSFGRKAFRRPLSKDEVAGFDAIIAKGSEITPKGAPSEVAELLLSMFLVSPSFLQREELIDVSDSAGHLVLSSYEVAARLAYMLWGSTPDETLNRAADDQQLKTSEQILQQARRMLGDPKARDRVAAFHRSYMLMGTNTRWDNTNHDSLLFPAFKRDLVGALQKETEMFFDNITFGKRGTFEDLLLSSVAFVSSATAPLYGLDPAKFTANLSETNLDANHPGFLTRLGFLNAYSGYDAASPILRGAFITKQVLGVPIGAPPPGASDARLPDASADLNTNRKRYDALTSGAQCAGCHKSFINPPGFALESFNAVGSFQTTERDTGARIDTSADVTVDPAEAAIHVTGPAELMAAIARSHSAKAQYASKWVSYATGRDSDPGDACTVEQLAAKMMASGYTLLELITDLSQTPAFRIRTVEP